jgi:hypothetical protein
VSGMGDHDSQRPAPVTPDARDLSPDPPRRISEFFGCLPGIVVGLILAAMVFNHTFPQNKRVLNPPLENIILILTLPTCIGPLVGLLIIVAWNAWRRRKA